MKEMKDSLEEKEERNNQLLTELTAHEEMMVKLIKSVADKVARSNQEELEAERTSQNNIMKQIVEG